MQKVKILIVEDEMIIAEHIADSLEEFGYEVMEPAISYAEALATIEEEMPDLALLDVQISGRKTGIDLAQIIHEKYQFPFIFLTSNSDRVTLGAAKQTEPAAFLVKPYSKDELYTSIEIALYNFAQRKTQVTNRDELILSESLFIRQNKVYQRLDFADILYLESDHVYLDLIMRDGNKHTVRGNISEYLAKLGPRFIRCHRSYVINLDHLKGINTIHLQMGEVEIPLGKKYRDEILSLINKS